MRKAGLLVILLAGLAIMAQGCWVVLAGAGAGGTVAYVRGDLQGSEAYSLDTVYKATKAALEKLELKATSDQKDALSATIIARDAGDNKITVTLGATTEKTTSIDIRIGIFGDQTKSMTIYNEIKKNLQ